LDAFDLSLISLVAGYVTMILVGFLVGNIFLILDGIAILLSLFVFLAGVVAVHSLRSSVKNGSLELSDRQFVVVSLSIVGSLAVSLWIGPWTLVMGLLFVPAITSAIFAMAFKNKLEKSEHRRLAKELARSWT
jgi:hypothetical protein